MNGFPFVAINFSRQWRRYPERVIPFFLRIAFALSRVSIGTAEFTMVLTTGFTGMFLSYWVRCFAISSPNFGVGGVHRKASAASARSGPGSYIGLAGMPRGTRLAMYARGNRQGEPKALAAKPSRSNTYRFWPITFAVRMQRLPRTAQRSPVAALRVTLGAACGSARISSAS